MKLLNWSLEPVGRVDLSSQRKPSDKEVQVSQEKGVPLSTKMVWDKGIWGGH